MGRSAVLAPGFVRPLTLAVIFAVTGFVAAAAPHASFDCTKAMRLIDKLICSDDEVAGLDVKVAARYKAALNAHAADKDSLRDAQRMWIAKRDAECLKNRAPVQCLKLFYEGRLAELSVGSLPGGSLEMIVITGTLISSPFPLDDRALTAAHPAERSQMGFPQGVFSPKGDLFAFAVNNIVSGDPDQVWLYRFADKKLVAATPSPVRGKSSITIDSFSFVDDTLYIRGSSGQPGGAMTPFKRAATMAGANDVAAIPKAPPRPDLARDTTAEAADELSDQGDKREEDSHYVITSTNGGHGAITLSAHAKSGGPEWTIAQGTWGLAAFVFDAPRGRVLYGDDSRGLVSYDLKTRKTSVIAPVTGTLLDITNDGHRAAYSAYSGCNVRPGKQVGGAQTICFTGVP